MLTRDEQESIMQKVKAFVRLHLLTKRRLEHSEISPRQAKERLGQGEDELRDFLKEVG